MAQKPGNKPRKSGILLLGDCVIDHYWFLARHQSDTSSFAGFHHFKIASKAGDPIRALCGIGHTARTLNSRNLQIRNPFTIYCFGLWNAADHPRIVDLAQVASLSNKTKFNGEVAYETQPAKLIMKTLSDAADTIETYRHYQYNGTSLEQLSRIDWDSNTHPAQKPDALETLRNFKPDKEIGSIVIHDLGKGCVSPDVIDLLLNKYGDANWYVRSKTPRPGWITRLADRLYLNLSGPESTSRIIPWGRWIVGGRPSLDAVDYLKSMPGKMTVAISKDHEVVIRSQLSGRCIIGKSSADDLLLTQLGWASQFFSDFAFEMIKSDNKPPVNDENAEHAVNRLIRNADNEPRLIDPKQRKVREITESYARALPWEKTVNEWRMSHQGKGIIRGVLPPRLELWRSSGILHGYIACVQEKRELIKKIGRSLASFKSMRRPPASLSILLTADPGAGKSSLIRALCAALDFSLIQTNITQLLRREELTHLFDEIAARQANTVRPILVFVDEINASLEAEKVFGAFLAPLEDGVYHKLARRVSLRPCVWIFVGTPEGPAGNAAKVGATDKYEDFVSRISLMARLDYSHLLSVGGEARGKPLRGEARLEQVYLGVRLLRENHPDVAFVEEAVIDSFYDLPPERSPARLIKRRASSVRGVQSKTVRRENCDGTAWEDVEWSKNTELIEID